MQEELELLDIIVMLRRRWWLIVIIVMLGCAAALGIGRTRTPIYEASSKLIMTSKIDKSAKGDEDSAASSSVDPKVIQANLLMLQTYKDIVRTPNVMKKVAAEHPELGLSAGAIAGKLTVSASATSQLLTISARDDNYSRAVLIVNAVSTAFIEETVRLYGSGDLEVLYPAEDLPGAWPQPVNMGLKMLLMVAFVLSAMVSAGLCFVLQYFDRWIRTECDVTRTLGFETLIEVPLFIESGKRGLGRRYTSYAKLRGAKESHHVPIEK
ncbi:LPS biosynthesis protein [Paenibacillus sp. CCS19]|uniref:YveK family protein n=1 Tax=Paenibacillus sp. CCS19 TaxID=3158387 RepID=UPI002562CFA1|nr:Wzz/FepE/Etk N-terminal domain-containing protein [Paenibacillus cellulosilyticus]GMK38126.1 LPS biosynthesis protein [Paenibacillus cellulosilyticus]